MVFGNAVLIVSLFVGSTVAQSTSMFWINNVPAYSQLDNCASQPLSTIVRGQSYGCGMLTSYSCFCTASSAHFNSVISQLVAESCPGTAAEITSAQAVFQSYCQINGTITANPTGAVQGAVTTAASPTNSSIASPSSTLAPSTPTPTNVALPTASSLSSGISMKDFLGQSILTAACSLTLWVTLI